MGAQEGSDFPQARGGLPKPVLWAAIAVAVIYGGYRLWHHFHHSAAPIDPAVLAQDINATSCTAEPYYLVLAGNKHVNLYDCVSLAKGDMCVGVLNGIPQDLTTEAKFAFANALGRSKPTCVKG